MTTAFGDRQQLIVCHVVGGTTYIGFASADVCAGQIGILNEMFAEFLETAIIKPEAASVASGEELPEEEPEPERLNLELFEEKVAETERLVHEALAELGWPSEG